jgi:hypothetical protein
VERADHHGVEIRDVAGTALRRLEASGYLTDFGAIRRPGSDKQDVVMYTYPNAQRGGSFRVVTADGREVAAWEESPPPSSFAVGPWSGALAIFYLQANEIVVRAPTGERLARLSAPGADAFSRLFVTSQGRYTVVVASGGGYTPYHMVAVYADGGRLVFQEFAPEHAFGVETDAGTGAFIVSTRSSRWRYGAVP